MENLVIEETPITPAIDFDAGKGILRLSGKSIIENPFEFYEELMKWVEEYSQKPAPETTVTVDLAYFNTSSSKCLLNFLKKASRLAEGGHKLTIRWCYDHDDDDTYDTGGDFSRLTKIPFEFVEKS